MVVLSLVLFCILLVGGTGLRWFFRDHSSSVVIIYAAQDQVYAEPILREFNKGTGIKVKAVFDSEAVKTVGLALRRHELQRVHSPSEFPM